MNFRDYLGHLQDVFLRGGCDVEEGAREGHYEDAVGSGQGHGGHSRDPHEPCWVSASSGFFWFLLTSGYIIAFLLTALLACQIVLHSSRFGRDHRVLSRHWWTPPPPMPSPLPDPQ